MDGWILKDTYNLTQLPHGNSPSPLPPLPAPPIPAATLAPPGVRRRSFTLHKRPNSFIPAHIGIRDPRASPIFALTIASRLPPRGAEAAATLPPLHMRRHSGTGPRPEQRSRCAKQRGGGAEQRRAASGRAAAGGRGGWLPYRPIEDTPLHGLRGGAARANPVRREAVGIMTRMAASTLGIEASSHSPELSNPWGIPLHRHKVSDRVGFHLQ
ncbi:hypothetical protein PVAP13_5KG523228 [Panicum virgatum]|uniref:Uncharacterized protein n=1 Tax=Panicum virgatum TaxID=38727 RepID=A0A8T0SPC9_PANVG|nr:hypothetical protein PVAP13_5KG523228 [Panicum virgatum]